ncbi:MAG: hypothetical protein R2798_13535 [Chitinophagales bacterium]
MTFIMGICFCQQLVAQDKVDTLGVGNIWELIEKTINGDYNYKQ